MNFSGTHFISTQLTQRIFSVWLVAQPVFGEMDMHCVANLATLQTPLENFFPFKKAPKPNFWESPGLPCEVLLSQCAHTSLSLFLSQSLALSLCVCSVQRTAERSSAFS